MRSTNILILLIALNASAAMIGYSGLGEELGYQPTIGGDEEIDDAEAEAEQIESDPGSFETFIGGIISAARALTELFSIAIAGPRLFINLGVPTEIVGIFAAPLYILVSIDILEVISGRNLT